MSGWLITLGVYVYIQGFFGAMICIRDLDQKDEPGLRHFLAAALWPLWLPALMIANAAGAPRP